MLGTVLETTEEDWDQVTDINQKGLFFLTQAHPGLRPPHDRLAQSLR